MNYKRNKEQDIKKYHEYLQTESWKQKQQQRFEIDKYRCVMCGSAGTRLNPLHCHHLDYHHIYNERVYTDLVTLCSVCHHGVHLMMNRQTDAEGHPGWKDSLTISECTLEPEKLKKLNEW